jgi:sigma-B regulation protein RsbU (phosphoserine phosphatase)
MESGGDYFDFYEWDDGHFGVLVADVAGHGAGAAVVVAMLQAILHTIPPGAHTSPADVLTFLNEHLVRKRIENSFVTAFCAKFSPDRRTMQYANAGHNRPVLRRGPEHDGAVHDIDGAASVPLGVLDDPGYHNGRVDLHLRDTLLFYTDGIVEAFAPGPPGEREMFGLPRLRSSVEECSGMPQCVVDSLHQRLFEHTGQRTRDDDQTIVAVRVIEQSTPKIRRHSPGTHA